MEEEKDIKEEKASSKKKASPKKKKNTPVVPAVMPSRPRVYSFEQWAKRKGIPQHHKRGMKAFVSNVSTPRTIEEWDRCFKNY